MTAALGQWGWGAWAWLILPLTSYGLISAGLFAFGRTDPSANFVTFFFRQIADSLRRATGFPGWAMAGVLTGLLFLLVLVIGFYWDVAWHIDYGRDTQLLTPSHVMILVGLGGLVFASALTVIFASLEHTDAGIGVGGIRVPWSTTLLLALGAGGIAAFPLDNLWHQAYGIDVTLWSPTHLQLVGGGSLATIALLLMCAEALPEAEPNLLGRAITVLTAGTILVGMSTFQAEFDYGVPQFQVLYLPLLIVAAAGFSLVLARVALGAWGALKVAVVAVALRGLLAAAVGGALRHTVPRFPLYLPCALAVEAVAWALGTRPRLRFAVTAGAAVGTAGLLGELVWAGLSGWSPPQLPAGLAARIAIGGPIMAVAAAVLGVGLARAFSPERDDPLPVLSLVVAGAVVIGALAYPLPRRVGHVQAVIRLHPTPAPHGPGGILQGGTATVEVRLTPPGAADHASAFAVSSWQGGGRVTARLGKVGPGLYRATAPVPVSGRWKTVISLDRGDQVMAAPVYLPADPQIGAPPIPALPERTATFVRNTSLLLREAHPGPGWPKAAAYTGLAALLALWVALMATAARHIQRRLPDPQAARPPDLGPAGPGDGAPAAGDRGLGAPVAARPQRRPIASR